jgi:hypothetical protein
MRKATHHCHRERERFEPEQKPDYTMNMRVLLPENQRIKIFERLAQLGLQATHVARELRVSARTFRDWKRGKYTIPA